MDDPSPVDSEMANVISAAPTRSAQVNRYAALRQRLDAAAAGELFEEDDENGGGPPLKPVRRDPHLWEIRWNADGEQWRFYHAEPDLAPGYLVGLRFHLKEVDGTPDEVRDAQNAQIDHAARRYDLGRSNLWGLP